jgi:signal transduction histidine kinase
VLPLVIDDRPLGALALSFPESCADRDLMTFAQALIGHCAQALERARLFDAEREARDEAEQASRAKSEFLATLSHELRNPLHTIGCCGELLAARSPLTELQLRDLGRLQHARKHIAGLVDSILDFGRLESDRLPLETTRFALWAVIRDAAALLYPAAESRGVTLRTSPPETELHVKSDEEKLRRIVVNLLSNAVKFTDAGGTVTLDCIRDAVQQTVTITVADTGCGIPEEWLERIFEPFVQVDRTRVAEALQGLGLGLSISRGLAQAMGGTLTAASTPGEGSRFMLTLPYPD